MNRQLKSSRIFMFSRSEACGRYCIRHGHPVRPGQERQQNFASDSIESVSENQCQTWRRQQHSRSYYSP